MAPPEVEGYIEYSVPNAGKPCKTWYRVVGDLKAGTRPLVHLHGGPGCPYNIAASLADLTSSYGIPVIFYDQMGTGLSTHLPEKRGDASFWNVELFLRELDLVLTHLGVKDDYDLLGHSWGGMLGACHAAAQPPGLKRLVLSSSPAASRLWTEAQLVLRSELPQDMQAVLKKHEDAGTTNSKEHKSVMDFYYSQHLCRLTPWPADVMTAVKGMMEDDSVFMTMNGSSEWVHTGSLRDWSIIPEAHKIAVPTLLTNGRFDQAQDSTMQPLFQEIPRVKWVQFAESSHMAHVEERERYMQVVADFLEHN